MDQLICPVQEKSLAETQARSEVTDPRHFVFDYYVGSLDPHRLAKTDGEEARRVPRGVQRVGPGRQTWILATWAKRLEQSVNRPKRKGLRNAGDPPRAVPVTGGLEMKE